MKKLSKILVQGLLWLALILALVGSLRHVAWGFSTLEQGNVYAGYVQAVAVDLGLLALALDIQSRARVRRGTVVLWFGVFLFCGISTYANALHGKVHMVELTLSDTWALIASWRPIILSAVLPILVIYLSEIVGADVSYAVKVAEKEQRRLEREARRQSFGTEEGHEFPYDLDRARATANTRKLNDKTTAVAALLDYLADHPHASLSEAGRVIGRSKTTVRSYMHELEADGRIERNGDGVEVNG